MKCYLLIQSGTMFDQGFMIFSVGTTATGYMYLELIAFMIIGIMGGLLGALFTALNLWVTKFRGEHFNKKKPHRVYEVMVIVSISSLLQYFLPFLFPCK